MSRRLLIHSPCSRDVLRRGVGRLQMQADTESEQFDVQSAQQPSDFWAVRLNHSPAKPSE